MPPAVTNAYEAVMNELRTRLALSPVHRDVWTLRATGKHTRTEITTALKHMLAHAHSEYEGMPKCWPCALARKAVEGQLTTSSRDSPMRKPCSIILGELCKRIINDTSSSPSIKRGACIAVHTLCRAARRVNAADSATLTLALMATIVPQLALQERVPTGRPDNNLFKATESARNDVLMETCSKQLSRQEMRGLIE